MVNKIPATPEVSITLSRHFFLGIIFGDFGSIRMKYINEYMNLCMYYRHKKLIEYISEIYHKKRFLKIKRIKHPSKFLI